MAIIDLVSEDGWTAELAQLDARVRTYTGAPRTSNYVRAAAHCPHYLATLADEGQLLMPDSALERRSKETIAVAVSMANGCKYCVQAHSTLLKRSFGLQDADLVQLAALAGHVCGLAALACALQIQPDGSALGPLQPTSSEESELCSEIRETLGELPTLFAILQRRPELLRLLWEREQATLHQGRLPALDRHLAALAVAATRGAGGLVARLGRALGRLGVGEDALLEACLVADAFNKNNTFTRGLQLDLGVWRPSSQDSGPRSPSRAE